MLQLPKNEYRISITSGCNMKCVYCHNEGNKVINQLSKDDIESLIVNSYDLGLEQVRLTGGEPLIHKEIFDICQMLAEKYHLKVGINTNIIEIDKLMYMIEKGWIYRVVVGLDYFDAPISKQSPVGISSKQALENILRVKETGVNVTISTVYNGDYDNLSKLVNWAHENGIRIKILEEVKNEIADSTDIGYLKMKERILNDFNLEPKFDDNFKEWHGMDNDFTAVTFFHSHCRIRECDVCKKMHLRVTSCGSLKQCLMSEEDDVDFRDGNIRENVIKALSQPVNFDIKPARYVQTQII